MGYAATLRKLKTRLNRKKAREAKVKAKQAIKNQIATLRKQLSK
jgi:hypothetical protein